MISLVKPTAQCASENISIVGEHLRSYDKTWWLPFLERPVCGRQEECLVKQSIRLLRYV